MSTEYIAADDSMLLLYCLHTARDMIIFPQVRLSVVYGLPEIKFNEKQ
jgi:hypothetical protein